MINASNLSLKNRFDNSYSNNTCLVGLNLIYSSDSLLFSSSSDDEDDSSEPESSELASFLVSLGTSCFLAASCFAAAEALAAWAAFGSAAGAAVLAPVAVAGGVVPFATCPLLHLVLKT